MSTHFHIFLTDFPPTWSHTCIGTLWIVRQRLSECESILFLFISFTDALTSVSQWGISLFRMGNENRCDAAWAQLDGILRVQLALLCSKFLSCSWIFGFLIYSSNIARLCNQAIALRGLFSLSPGLCDLGMLELQPSKVRAPSPETCWARCPHLWTNLRCPSMTRGFKRSRFAFFNLLRLFMPLTITIVHRFFESKLCWVLMSLKQKRVLLL